MKISNNSNLEISTKGLFILSGVIVLVGFILLLLDHPVIGVMVFLISSCVFIVHSIITAAKQESGNKAKKAVKGGVAGCGSTILIFILFGIGMVNSPSINRQSVSNDISTPISYQDIVETVDSSISTNSETIIKTESNTSSVKLNEETQEKTVRDTELNSKSPLTDTESKLSQSTTSKLELKNELEIEKKTETTSSTYIELPSQATIYQIVINEETKKFHLSSCYKTDEILPDHRRVIDITDGSLFEVIQKLENDGYSHCKICLD